ncbi:uncharacterized protein RCC_01498 [Ramularia collo-cygni]|uniref:Trichothecene 3-O-acetyltransferase n=1 Tax=Ramularia collo-cygni TaxID=112498 RepID=A0A2D3V5T7_9PEZI|nr:uncharacterized protein RCC_01498 [Ramularia collo-cygni]CZT15663.1 uncharacterized protein RCC_01498 [Ramularia collo-cygni]
MPDTDVYPTQQQEKLIRLSICDTYSPKVWVTQTHFFPLKNQDDFIRIHEVLREGLKRTLDEIPALAGTILRESDDPRDISIKIENDSHIEFPREDLSQQESIPSFSTLEADGFPMKADLVWAFSKPETLTPTSEGARLLAVKLNLIKGGLALSFGFNHLLADASTVAEVERIWSLHSADISAGREQQRYKGEVDDSAIRSRLSKPSDGVGPFTDEHWKLFPTEFSQLHLSRTAVTKEAALSTLEQTKEAHLAALGGKVEKTLWAIWEFSPESLVQLKKDATGTDAAQWISTMDALVGLFWSRFSAIKQKSKEGHDQSLLLFPINIRQRLQPAIPAQYIGNAVDIVFAETSLAELEKSESGLQYAAREVRKAVAGYSTSAWAAWLTMAAGLPNDKAICPDPVRLLATHNLGFNDYSKSQSNTLDWGSDLGRAARTRYCKPAASLAGCAPAVIVNPRLFDGGLEVATTVTEELCAALQKDAVFEKYGKLTTAYL